MLKHLCILSLSLFLLQPAFSATIRPYKYGNCHYEGEVGKNGKPEGKGMWSCQDGRSYQGLFKNGEFEGKGVYTAPVKGDIYLEPFSVNSSKLLGMTLEGTFKAGMAHDTYRVSKNGEPVFNMKYERGMLVEVKLPKKNAK